jgi:hypothetical protein
MAEIKHVGRVIKTKKKCIVAYRTLPGDAHYCLVVPTESLPDSYHDAIINLVEGPAGQSAYEFAEAMARTTFPDGSNMLAALHTQGRLVKVPTGDIEMTPTTSTSIQLSELNQIIAEQRGIAIDDLSIKGAIGKVTEVEATPSTPAAEDNNVVKTTSQSVNEDGETAPTTFDTPDVEAKFYRSQADKLAKQAAEFRRKAEELVPTKKAK